MTPPTPHFRVAEADLGENLRDYIRDRRLQGASFESIATDLTVDTRGAVRVSGMTIRNWAVKLGVADKGRKPKAEAS